MSDATIVLLSILSAIPGNITSSLLVLLRVRSTSKQCHRQWTSDVYMVLRSKRIIRNLSYRPAIIYHVTNTTDMDFSRDEHDWYGFRTWQTRL